MQKNLVANKLLAGIAFFLVVTLLGVATIVPLSQNDFWLQAKIGEIVVNEGSVPKTLLFPFTYARNFSFNSHEWATSVVLHALDSALRVENLNYMQGLAGLLLFFLSFSLSWRLTRSSAISLAMAAVAMTVENYRHYLRPEIFGLMLLLVELHVLTWFKETGDWKKLIYLVPVQLVWSNAHGSFLLGPVTTAFFAVGEFWETYRRSLLNESLAKMKACLLSSGPYSIATVVLLITSVLTPSGFAGLQLPFSLSNSEVAKTLILEWLPTFSPLFLREPWLYAFIIAAVAGGVVIGRNQAKLTVTELLLFTGFLLLAISRMRYVVWFGFICLYVCSQVIGQIRASEKANRYIYNFTALLAAVGIGFALKFGNMYGASYSSVPSFSFSPEMVSVLDQSKVSGNVLNSYELGSELVYRFYPRIRPSIDSRIDSYGDRYFILHTAMFRNESGLRQFLNEYGVHYMVLHRGDFDSVSSFPFVRQNWRVVYYDEKEAVLERQDVPG